MAFNPTASLPGAVNNAGDNRALFLKVFSGEVLSAFNRTTQFIDKHRVRKITSGKSAQFPMTGQLARASKYLTQGDSVTQAVLNSAEQVITVDGFLYESLFLAKQDEAFNHVDVRQEYSTQLGESLGNNYDFSVACTGIIAARSANPVTGLPGGSVIENANAGTDGEALFSAIFEAMQKLAEKDVKGKAYVYVRPEQYMLLAQLDKVVNKDVNNDNGAFNTGIIKGIAGAEIVMTNNLPNTNVTGTINGKYDVDATNTVALVMTEKAVGTVKLMDITTDMDWMTEYQAHLMVAGVMMGHGVLQPECAVEITTLAV